MNWENIANTIPANPDYITAVNINVKDSEALNSLWGKDVRNLLEKGLSLDSLKPSHIVVVNIDGTIFITWPLPAPKAINNKIGDWPQVSLNNTVDAYMLTEGNASLVVSSTQAWVVNNSEGDNSVNNLLSAALNTKAVHTQPYAECIVNDPELMAATFFFDNRYYYLQMSHDDGQVRIDVDAFSKRNKRLELVDGLGRLSVATINEASAKQPFAVFDVEKGTLPKLIDILSKVFVNKDVSKGAELLSNNFANASGIVVAQWANGQINFNIPFVNHFDAEKTAKALEQINDSNKYKLRIETKGNKLIVQSHATDSLASIDLRSNTPHTHTQTENPSAISFAKFEIDGKLPVELYFELAPTHARLQIDYKESEKNFATVLEFMKEMFLKAI